MGKTILDITMSVDGFIAGPSISKENPLGINGPLLHKWIFEGKTSIEEDFLREYMPTVGAVITGNRTYTTAIEGAWEAQSPFEAPVFVLCHQRPAFVVAGFTFVHDGIESALLKAKTVAGDKNILIMGGADIAQQFLYAGLVDELQLHFAPVILGQGTPLFRSDFPKSMELVKTKVIDSKSVTHFFFQLS